MDYKLYDHRTMEFLGWLRNQGAVATSDKIRWSGKDWEVKDGPKLRTGFGNPGHINNSSMVPHSLELGVLALPV